MGIVTGLKNIQSTIDKNEGGGGSGVKYLKLADNETVKVRFLQELDPESAHFNETAGLGFLAVEHQKPKEFRTRALCTADEGACWACQQHQKDFKAGWRPKVKLYVNVLVERANGDKEVLVLSQGNGPKSVTPWLLEFAGEIGSITNRVFRMKRTGSGQTDTAYTLTPMDPDPAPYDVTQHELFDLKKAVKDVPFEEQENYYGGAQTPALAGVGSDSDDW